MTAANVVVFFDIGYNPQIERQAIDRVYRYGQTKPVKVITLMSKDSQDYHVKSVAKAKEQLIAAFEHHQTGHDSRQQEICCDFDLFANKPDYADIDDLFENSEVQQPADLITQLEINFKDTAARTHSVNKALCSNGKRRWRTYRSKDSHLSNGHIIVKRTRPSTNINHPGRATYKNMEY